MLPIAPYVLVGDTDAHGITLTAAVALALLSENVPASQIIIHNNFSTRPDQPATTTRGGIIRYLDMLITNIKASRVKPIVYMLDIPAPIDENQFAAFTSKIIELAKVAVKIVYIDTASHGNNKRLESEILSRRARNIIFYLTHSVPETYLPAVLNAQRKLVAWGPIAEKQKRALINMYLLALIGSILDMDLDNIDDINMIYYMLEESGIRGIKPVTIEDVRQHLHEFLAFDNYLKFGKDWDTFRVLPFRVWGNMARKVAVLASHPVTAIYQRAVKQVKMPTVSEIKSKTKIQDYVAVVDEEAPRGHIFNYSKLAQAAVNAPAIITYGPGFQPGKKVITVTANMFEPNTIRTATNVIDSVVPQIYDVFKQKGWSDDQDYPRGGPGAKTLGVNEKQLYDALEEIVRVLNQKLKKVI